MRMATQQIFEDWVCTHNAISNGGTPGATPAAGSVPSVEGQFSSANSSWSLGTRTPNLQAEFSFSSSSGKIKKHMNTPFFQLDFCDMFTEPKQEILRMMKGDLFMRWKKTKDFQFFITNLKPYEEVSIHSNHSRSSLVSDLNKNNDGNNSQQSSLRKVLNSAGLSRENSLKGVMKNLSVHR